MHPRNDAGDHAKMSNKADPHWMKQTMVEDYRNGVVRSGGTPNMQAIEKLAVQDLNTCDNVWSEQKPAPKKKRKEVDLSKMQAEAAKSGLTLYKKPIDESKDKRDSFADGVIDAKWQAALGRMAQICSPQSNFDARKTFDVKMQGLALEFVLAMDSLQKRIREFKGKNAVDCRRIFRRKVEDICDRSTGRLGPWWVK